MADALAQGLLDILRPDVLLALLVGAVGGVVIGAIPGVGAAVAIAIALPATFGMDPLAGLVLLLGIYGASAVGGAVPAILVNTPGTPVNALTTYDGHPLARRGEAARALTLAYGASFYGGVFSVLCLMILAPSLAAVAPWFGSRDIFMAAVLGAALVIVSHRGQTLQAGALFFLGAFLHGVGLETARFSQRYTFGQSWLASGFDLIVALLGLFAVSQAFFLLINPPETPQAGKAPRALWRGILEPLRFPKVLNASAGFGVLMGIIPGVGEFLAQFFSYSAARKWSRNPDRFGKGAPDGLIASETANNAVPAAAMVPLLALGIPGEALTAMMLSVFHVHNIVPGPQLFSGRPEFLVSLFACLLAVNILMLLFLLGATRPLLRVTRAPSRLLGVCVLTLAFVGVYSLRNSAVDCAVAACFGWFGFILRRLKWPLTPLLLGMVLGRIMDEKFRNSLARLETPLDLISRPVAGALFVILVVALAAHFMSLRAGRAQGEKGAEKNCKKPPARG